MRREGTPAWMQAVKRRLEQAAEEARNRPAKAGIPPCVIPAKAGIQWFIKSIPAKRECPFFEALIKPGGI